jgi:arsenate reductase
MQGHYNVLFLCTGNSARSIMAEAILNFKGRPNFTAYSAGGHPGGQVRPEALRELETAHIPTEGLHSKPWQEFSAPDAPKLDFVFTVCDNAAKEVCPVWPGQPLTAHWGIPDPASIRASEADVERAFRDAFLMLDRSISLFLCLPLASLDKLALKKELDNIGQETTAVMRPMTQFPASAACATTRSDNRMMLSASSISAEGASGLPSQLPRTKDLSRR